MQITKFRNKRGDITKDFISSKSTIKQYYSKQCYAIKQKPTQYCKVINFQLNKCILKKKTNTTPQGIIKRKTNESQN